MSSRRANKGSFHMFIWGEGHRPQHTGTHWDASMKTERDCFIRIEKRRREGLSSLRVHTEEPHHCGVCTSVRGNLKVAETTFGGLNYLYTRTQRELSKMKDKELYPSLMQEGSKHVALKEKNNSENVESDPAISRPGVGILLLSLDARHSSV